MEKVAESTSTSFKFMHFFSFPPLIFIFCMSKLQIIWKLSCEYHDSHVILYIVSKYNIKHVKREKKKNVWVKFLIFACFLLSHYSSLVEVFPPAKFRSFNKGSAKKSRIRETKHLSTDADSSTNAIGGWTRIPENLIFLKN